MKTKIPILIAAGLILASVSKAQYGAPCADNRVVIQAHLGFPVPVAVGYNYSYGYRERYDDHRYEDHRSDDRRYDDRRYDDRRDWREVEYDRYCHENRGYRMSREDFYRDRCDYRGPRRVEYGRY